MPYYGNPETVRWMVQGLSASQGREGSPPWEDQLALADSLVTPLIEARLAKIFSAWPAPTSQNINPISILWCYAVTDEMTGVKGSHRQAPTRFESKAESRYETLIGQIERNELPVPGATRRANFSPSVSEFTPPRVEVREFEEPVVVADMFPVGLRSNVPG